MATNQDSSPSGGAPYQPSEIEGKQYSLWEKKGYFSPHWQYPQSPLSSRPSEESWANFNSVGIIRGTANGQGQSATSSIEMIERPSSISSLRYLQPLVIPTSIFGAFSGTNSETSQQDERPVESSQNSLKFGNSSAQGQSDTNPSTSPSLVNIEEAIKSASLDYPPKTYFSMFTAPPNITGNIHCGHALAISLEDVLARYHRMRGLRTLFIPGLDHAGIATQSAVERKLIHEEGKDRHQTGRPRFTKYLNEWKDEYCGKISSAFRCLGASMDWGREAFSMDQTRNEAAMEAFVRLHEQGVIYRGNHIVNWCPTLRSAISELEIDTLEIDGPTKIKVPGYTKEVEFGVLYYYKYLIVRDDNTSSWIEMTTSRPELLVADSGIAVHPEDKRHARLIGLNARHPYSSRLLPIVGDYSVNRRVGTGAISIAPGHSDYFCEIGKRSKLPFIVVFKDDGRVTEAGELWKGQQRFELRQTIIENLEERNLLLKKEPCKETLQICSRSGDVVEQMSKSEWWLRMGDIAEGAAKVVRDGEIKMRPQAIEAEYLGWLKEPKDWCLSRQSWWGQRVPAWFLSLKEEERNALKPDHSNPKRWMVARTEEEARKQGESAFPDEPFRLTRDEAVLDSWFAAAIWPLSTLGWPEGEDFREFYPTTILDTGSDTLFSWVTKMVAVCLKLTGHPPFKEVFFHPLVRDFAGRKMSKSLGNVLDPLDIVSGTTLEALNEKLLNRNLPASSEEFDRQKKSQATCFPGGIPECGADALRLALIDATSESQDVFLNVNDVIRCRNFCDGLYKTVHEALAMLPSDYNPTKSNYGQRMAQRVGDRYILHRLNAASRVVEGAIEGREFWKATRGIKDVWCHHIPAYLKYHQSCGNEDPDPEGLSPLETLYTIIDRGLRLAHPFMPFITEELWQKLPRFLHDNMPSIMVADFPKQFPEYECSDAEEKFELFMLCTSGIQSLYQENGCPEVCTVYVKPVSTSVQRTIETYLAELQQQSGRIHVEFLRLGDDAPAGSILKALSEDVSIHLSIRSQQLGTRNGLTGLRLELEVAQRTVFRQEAKLREMALRDSTDERDRKAEEARLEGYRTKVKNFIRVISDLSNP
ncbi:valine--tRNA ligase [Orbilia blumenaviensis]|uniref:valine--tRNA ligase n=1 Tax=Orbilia blumenaviensis TaxID=1796055 RepID=A0AAV9VJX0_9PEZI